MTRKNNHLRAMS